MLENWIIQQLAAVTEEEQAILDGRTSIDRDLYMQDQSATVNSQKLLSSGKLITMRPNTRFIHFPEHTHDYVEVVYMYRGETTHIVSGDRINLHQGELLFLGQSASHEILPAGENDIAVNFIVLPEFFRGTLAAIGEEATPLRRFLIDCLFGHNTGPGYLHFRVSSNLPIQNLAENLMYALSHDIPNKRKVSQMTMTLLFLQLMGHTDKLSWKDHDESILKILRYIETNYAEASLTGLSQLLHWDVSGLCREIKRKTGKTFTELLQEKRLSQAAFLLSTTDRKVEDISLAVGYENISYFHRIFRAAYGVSPRQYRLAK